MIYLEEVKHHGEHKLWCRFNTGETGIADLKDVLWGPMFEALKDENEFKKIRLSETFHTVVWENGADIAPEALYERAIKIRK